MPDHDSQKEEKQGTLGTFAGVFTPSILTILGIILFLRLGFVVGSTGLAHALLIIGLANIISVLTSISLSAIATNIRVKGGGDYYLISRTLGKEFGGSLGIVLFLAQSVSIGFYLIGFGEALTALLPASAWASTRLIAMAAVCLLFLLAWMGADLATKFQYAVMALLTGALVSFFAGGFIHWDSSLLTENWGSAGQALPFWALFAIFFPAVTGFTQGVSMSGDLKDPAVSLPRGTFLAVGISLLVYFGVAIFFAATMPNSRLAGDVNAMKKVAYWGWLIDAGVIAATLSSAMASFLGAPRILQSLASDRILPGLDLFAKGDGPTRNPRRAVLLSGAIALMIIALGNLNLIASVVSMFFLISYGLLNYATYYEARTFSPSFRPRLKWFDARLSLAGFLTCLGVMMAIDIQIGLVALSIIFAVYQYLKRTTGPSRWADSSRSYHLQKIREHLLGAAAEPEHPRDWRPQILAFSTEPERRKRLLEFSRWLEGGSGLTTAVQIVEGTGYEAIKRKKEIEEELRRELTAQGSQAFPLVITAEDLQSGGRLLVQAFGIGPIKANTILLNWLEETPHEILHFSEWRYGQNLKPAFRHGANIVILDCNADDWQRLQETPDQSRRIDILWANDDTSRMMLLLGYLMTRHKQWSAADIRVLTTADEMDNLKQTLEDVRIQAKTEEIADHTKEAIAAAAKDATLVFLPFRFKGNQILTPLGTEMHEMLELLPVVALGLAAKEMDLDAEPEAGEAGEMAAVMDALEDARRRSRLAEAAAQKASELAKDRLQQYYQAVYAHTDSEQLAAFKAQTLEATQEADRYTRKSAKALAKMLDAVKDAEALGVEAEKEAEVEEESS